MKRKLLPFLATAVVYSCNSWSFEDTSRTDHTVFAENVGGIVARATVCKLNASTLAAAFRERSVWVGRIQSVITAEQLNQIFASTVTRIKRTYRPSATSPCLSQAEIDETSVLLVQEINDRERFFNAHRKRLAIQWLIENSKGASEVNITPQTGPALIRANPTASLALRLAAQSKSEDFRYQSLVAELYREPSLNGMPESDKMLMATLIALKEIGDTDALQSVMWPLGHNESYPDALKRAYKAIDAQNKGR